MKHIKTITKANKQENSTLNERDIHYVSSCKTSVTVGWQEQEKKNK